MLVLTISPPSTFHQDQVVDAELVACTHRPIPGHIASYVKREGVCFFTDARFIIASAPEEVKEALAKDLIHEDETFLFSKFI